MKFELTNTDVVTGSPDLSAGIPAGWTDAILISKQTGTTTDGFPINPTDTVYVDVCIANFGTAATAAAFNYQVLVDGTVKYTGTRTAALNVNAGLTDLDINVGSLAAGVHTVTLKIDTGNAIAELDETDNSYSRSFYVGGGIPGQITGTIWHDLNEDAQITGGEPKLDGWRAFVDVDEDGVYDAGEPSDLTDSSGSYTITGVAPGPIRSPRSIRRTTGSRRILKSVRG